MKRLLLSAVVTASLTGCVTTTYVNPYTGQPTTVVQPAPGVAEAVAAGVVIGAIGAATRPYYRQYYYVPRGKGWRH
jgi:hypothetical protein